MNNMNMETGIAYGYISANALDSDIVHELMYGVQAKNISYARFLEELEQEHDLNTDEGQYAYDEALEYYEDDEPEILGVYEGVYYTTSWLGGALHFWIFSSPIVTQKARRASPCVPGAAILDTLDGDVEGYDVPAEWRVR